MIINLCKICGTEIRTFPSVNRQFCSQKCFGLSRRVPNTQKEETVRRAQAVFRKKHQQRLRDNGRAIYARKRDLIRQRQRDDRKADPERYRKYSRKFYARNRAECIADTKRRYKENINGYRDRENARRRANWGVTYMKNYKRQTDPIIKMKILVANAKARSKERGESFDNRILPHLLSNPPMNCACCGKPFNYNAGPRPKRGGDDSPSLDRVDNRIGYRLENVSVICCKCNWVKGASTEAELLVVLNYIRRMSPTVLPKVA